MMWILLVEQGLNPVGDCRNETSPRCGIVQAQRLITGQEPTHVAPNSTLAGCEAEDWGVNSGNGATNY